MTESADHEPVDRPPDEDDALATDAQQMLERLRQFGDRYEHDVFRSSDVASETQPEPARDASETPRVSDRPASATDDETDEPQSIGHFQIVRRLGQGGHGLVFLAYDPRLKRSVAIKIPRPEALLTTELRGRFLREAEAAAALNHPNLVPVFETGSDGAICYIAAAYVEGLSLAEWLNANAKPVPADAAGLVATLADAIQHAHSRGILHRDLKPSNILLAEPGDQPPPSASRLADFVPQITDFGLAKVNDIETDWTRSGTVLGTPAYVSPEQSVSSSNEIGPASDVYALGAILYELLAGRPPFQGKSVVETLQAVRQQEPGRLRRSEAPLDLEAICLKCLEKQPRHRYESAAALADDLQRFLDGHPVQARRVSTVQRLGRWIRRNPLVASVSAAALVLLIVSSATSTVGYWRTARALEDRNAALQAVDLHRDEALRRFELAQDVVADFLVEISNDKRLKTKPLEPLRRSMLELARDYYEKLLREAPDDPQVRKHSGLASWQLGNIHRLLGDFEESTAAYENSIRILGELAEKHPDNLELQDHLGRAYLDLGTLFYRKLSGRRADAWESAREVYERIETPARQLADAELRERILQNVGSAYMYAGGNRGGRKDYESAESYYQRALDIRRELVEQYPDTPDNRHLLAHSYCNLGTMNAERGRFEAATSHYEKSVETLAGLVDDHPDTPRFVHYLAEVRHLLYLHYSKHGTQEVAAEVLQAAIDGLEELCRRHPDVPEYMTELAKCHFNMAISRLKRKAAGSAESLDRTRDLIDQIRQRDYVVPWTLLMALYMTQGREDFLKGDFDAATEDYEAARDACQQQLVKNPDDLYAKLSLADVHLDLGRTAQKREDFELALKHYDEGVEVVSALLEKSNEWHRAKQQLGEILVVRASLMEKLTHMDEAFADRMRAAALGYAFRHEEELFGLTRNIAKNPQDARSYWKRGRRYYRLGQHEQVIADCTKAIQLQPKSFHPYWWRARASMKRLDFSQAVADWEQVIELNPRDSGAHLHLAWILLVGPEPMRDPARALALSQSDAVSSDNQTNEVQALALIRCGGFEEARKSLADTKGMVTSDFLMSLVHLHSNNPAAARRSFDDGEALLREKDWSDGFWDYCLETLRDEVAGLLDAASVPP